MAQQVSTKGRCRLAAKTESRDEGGPRSGGRVLTQIQSAINESACPGRDEAGPTCSVPEDEPRIAVGDALVIHDVIPNAACIGFTEIPIVSI